MLPPSPCQRLIASARPDWIGVLSDKYPDKFYQSPLWLDYGYSIEVNSSLDQETERAMQEIIYQEVREYTMIVALNHLNVVSVPSMDSIKSP